MRKLSLVLISAFVIIGVVGSYYFFRKEANPGRSFRVVEWIRNPSAHPDWALEAGSRCPGAPLMMPTYGYIGFLWDDSFRPGHRHSGLDIFGGTQPGETPIIAAFDGYLTRMPDWKSSLIIRVPSDPLQPGRQIWLYYTHMADPEGVSYISEQFPPGTTEQFVRAGTPLGLQGNFSGSPGNPTGVHLHFSIVLDDGSGRFQNELEIANTLDPSPYLGMNLNARQNRSEVPACGVEGGRP